MQTNSDTILYANVIEKEEKEIEKEREKQIEIMRESERHKE